MGVIDGIYEEIDESNMIDNVHYIRDSYIAVDDTNESYVSSDSNNYLTPYQPADEDAHTNSFNDNKSESSVSLGRNFQTLSNNESTSPSSDIQYRRSSYLKPYQPIIHSADDREYLTTHNRDYSDPSGSGTKTSESGYLNPYQTMIPNTSVHEYKFVLSISDESGSSLSGTSTDEKELKFPHPFNGVLSNTISKNFDIMTDDSKEESYFDLK